MHNNLFKILCLFCTLTLFVSCKKSETVRGNMQITMQYDAKGQLSQRILDIESNGKTYTVITSEKTHYIDNDRWYGGSPYEVKGEIKGDTIFAESVRYVGDKKKLAVREDISVEEKPSMVPVAIESEKMVEFEAVIVNIAGTDGSRFLKVAYKVGYDSDKHPNFEKKTSQYSKGVKNKVIEYLSSLTLKEVLHKNAKDTIRKDLKRELNRIFSASSVECSNIYIQDYLVQ